MSLSGNEMFSRIVFFKFTFVQRFLFFDGIFDHGIQQRLRYGRDGGHQFVDQVVDAERVVGANGVLEVRPEFWKKNRFNSIEKI